MDDNVNRTGLNGAVSPSQMGGAQAFRSLLFRRRVCSASFYRSGPRVRLDGRGPKEKAGFTDSQMANSLISLTRPFQGREADYAVAQSRPV